MLFYQIFHSTRRTRLSRRFYTAQSVSMQNCITDFSGNVVDGTSVSTSDDEDVGGRISNDERGKL